MYRPGQTNVGPQRQIPRTSRSAPAGSIHANAQSASMYTPGCGVVPGAASPEASEFGRPKAPGGIGRSNGPGYAPLVESDAYRLGALIARLLFLLVPVIVGVVLAVRWHRRGRRLGWLWGALIAIGGLVFALVVSFFAAGGRITAELDPSDALVAPEGYRFREAPALEAQTEQQLRADPDIGDKLQAVVVRDVVMTDNSLVGSVTVVALDPIVAGQPGQEDGFVRGLETRAGDEAEPLMLEGVGVFRLEVPPSETTRRVHILAWQQENLFVSLSAVDLETAQVIATKIIQTTNAT